MQNCYYHDKIETVLTCSRCNKPVCNKCTTESYVGIKCKKCGSIGKPDILNVRIIEIFRILALSLIFAFVSAFLFSGLIIMILNIDVLGNIQSVAIMFLRIISLICLVLFGVVNAELIMNLSKRKINKFFPIIAASSSMAYWIFIWVTFFKIFDGDVYAVWWYQFFYQPVAMLALGLSIYLSYSRVK